CQENQPILSVNSQSVTVDQLPAVLSGLMKNKPQPELLIDATGLEQWLDKLVRSVRLQAREAGVHEIHTLDNAIPFGPGLAVGLVLVMLSWRWIGPSVQFVLFNGWFLFGIVSLCAVLMLGLSYLLRMWRMLRTE